MPTNYSNYRPNIKSGDLLAWDQRNYSSLTDIFLILVQKILGIDYSHVGIAMVEGDRVMVIEANRPAVQLTPVSTTSDFYHFPLNIAWKSEYKDFLYRELGKRYSLLNYFRSLLKIKPKKGIWYCTQFAAYFYDSIGYVQSEEVGLDPLKLTVELMTVCGQTPVYVNLDTANDTTNHAL
jgi:hypothetical protein